MLLLQNFLGMVVAVLGIIGATVYLQLALRPGRRDRALNVLVAGVCALLAAAWGYATLTNQFIAPQWGRPIVALAAAAIVWLGLARSGT